MLWGGVCGGGGRGGGDGGGERSQEAILFFSFLLMDTHSYCEL
jgi:hypothetical protein